MRIVEFVLEVGQGALARAEGFAGLRSARSPVYLLNRESTTRPAKGWCAGEIIQYFMRSQSVTSHRRGGSSTKQKSRLDRGGFFVQVGWSYLLTITRLLNVLFPVFTTKR